MKFKVFDASREPEVLFKLEECSWGIRLVACDGEGNILPSGYILDIMGDGTLYCNTGVNNSIGLKLNSMGRVVINND